MRVGRVKVCSLQILVLLTYLGIESFYYKKICPAKVTIILFNTPGEFLVNNEKSKLDFNVVKSSISSGHLGFTSKRKKLFFFRRIAYSRVSYYPNSVSRFHYLRLVLSGDVQLHHGPTTLSSSTITNNSKLKCVLLNSRSLCTK